MATSNSQTQKSFSVLLSISLTFFLLLLNKVNSSESLAFSFTKFVPDQQNLFLQGDALVTKTGKLQLTKVDDGNPIFNSLGRVLYSTPVHIWDSTTGILASFVTSFSFVINVPDKAKPADGLTFFLAPVNTQPHKCGGLLGLFSNQNYNDSNQIVAIEFDTYFNAGWDLQGPHIGIDVNSIKSIKTASWGLANGQVANVFISYQASTKTLTSSLVHHLSQKSHMVSAIVDLKSVLPEWVRIGFSATTGLNKNYIQTHDVLSWSFDSKFADCNINALENNAHVSSYIYAA